MQIILVIFSLIIVLFTSLILWLGIHDEIYENIEKNKIWHRDGSVDFTIFFIVLSIISLIYIFKFINIRLKKKH